MRRQKFLATHAFNPKICGLALFFRYLNFSYLLNKLGRKVSSQRLPSTRSSCAAIAPLMKTVIGYFGAGRQSNRDPVSKWDLLGRPHALEGRISWFFYYQLWPCRLSTSKEARGLFCHVQRLKILLKLSGHVLWKNLCRGWVKLPIHFLINRANELTDLEQPDNSTVFFVIILKFSLFWKIVILIF